MYAQLNSANVAVGNVLVRGTVIGTVGMADEDTPPHLHLEVQITNNAGSNWRHINPIYHVEPFIST